MTKRSTFFSSFNVGLKELLLTVTIAVSIPISASERPPNVLFINVDDMNNDIGAYGHDLVHSPNLDALAEKGVLFDRAYSQSPMCTPSRSSYMTGLYPDQTGVIAHGSHTRLTAHFRDHIPNVTTLPQLFKENGYFSARVGKIYHQGVPNQIGTPGGDDVQSWNLTVNPKGIDIDDAVVAKINTFNARAKQRHSYGGTLSYLSLESEDEEHTDGKVATEAINIISNYHPEKTGRPLFLGVGFYRPHTPFVAPDKYFELYPLDKIQPYEMPTKDRNDIPVIALADRADQLGLTIEQRKEIIQGYYAAISYVDAQIGRVLKALDTHGIADNTIVVFLSDHGYELGQHGLWQKGSLFEGSTRSPLIIYAPKAKANGEVVKAPVELVDVYPTVASLAGLAAPHYLAGKDLTPSLNDSSLAVRSAAYSAILNRAKGPNNEFAYTKIRGHSIRTDRYRYTEWGNGMFGAELYDHMNDPEELTNLADKVHLEGTRIKLKWMLDEAINKAQQRISSIEHKE